MGAHCPKTLASLVVMLVETTVQNIITDCEQQGPECLKIRFIPLERALLAYSRPVPHLPDITQYPAGLIHNIRKSGHITVQSGPRSDYAGVTP